MNARRSLLVLAALSLIAADDSTPEDRAELLGAWTITQAEQAGKVIPPDLIAGQSLIFSKKTYRVRQDGQTIEEGTYIVDASKSPRTLDLTITKGPEDVGKRQLGIYQLDEGTLKVAFARPGAEKRPEAFLTSGDTGALFVMTLKRQASE